MPNYIVTKTAKSAKPRVNSRKPKADTIDCTGDGCIYDLETHTVSAGRREPLALTKDDLEERVYRAVFQRQLLTNAIRDMKALLAGKKFPAY